MTQSSNGSGIRRRAVLGGIAAGASAGVGGCLRRARSITGWNAMDQISLRIKTLPADSDPYALSIARSLAAWYGTAGIDAQVVPMSEEELLRQVLLRDDFDVFVARGPHRETDPDVLYGLLHSRFADTRGWQNPFGFTDLDVDELLETQRRERGEPREETAAELQRSIVRSQPFTVLAFPDDIRPVRRRNYTNWLAADLKSPQGYLVLERATGEAADGETAPDGGDGENASASGSESVLRIATTDRRATENLNPLSVEYRRHGALTGLVYDSIGYPTPGRTQPWLADSWAFTDDGPPRARVQLRSGLQWHDGEPVTAEDVAFTYALLADTSLGAAEEGTATAGDARIPAPRFQGRADLVEDVSVPDREIAVFEFVDCSPDVATRAFSVPILPKHVWQERTDPASISGIEVGMATDALVTNNIPPVGSGPFRFVRNTPRESLVLEAVSEHFLFDSAEGARPRNVGPPAFDRLVVQVVGSDDAAVGVVADGDADVTGTTVGASTVPRIGRSDGTELVVRRESVPYLVGYNTRTAPLSNPRFRHILAQLVDREHLAAEVFDGYAGPGTTLLSGTRWEPPDLRWDGEDPVTPFLGRDGEVDVGRAREAFRDAGFGYDDGRLVGGS